MGKRKSIKLSELQRHRVRESLNAASEILRFMKCQKLAGDDLSNMKILEEAVQLLELFQLAYHYPKN